MPNYKVSSLPSKSKDFKGSILGGFNIGINKNINDEKIKASLEVVKYLSSEEFQKKVIIKQLKLFSALLKLYDDEDCCQTINCDIIKDNQFFIRPSSTMKNYQDFSDRSVKLFHKFLNGELKVEEVLNKIEDITNIYSFTMKSAIGIIMMTLLVILSCIVIMSFFMILKYKEYFTLLTIDLWIIYIMGSVFMLTSTFEYFNEQTESNCIIRHIFIELSNSFIIIPIFYKLFANLPFRNKFSEWLKNNKYIYIIIFVSVHMILLIIINSLNTFKIKDINFENDEYSNYQRCDYNNLAGEILIKFQNFLNILFYFVMCFLVFLKWDIEETYVNLRYLFFIIFVVGITQIVDFILDFVNIKDYILYNIMHIFLNLLFVFISNSYIYVIIIKLLCGTKNISDKKKMDNCI